MAPVDCSSLTCMKPASQKAVVIIDRSTHDTVEVWVCSQHAGEARRNAEAAPSGLFGKTTGLLQRVMAR
ncbi:hypothetical protein BH24ACT26_BH24ACT26_08310 [soil metagenome]